MRIIHSLTILKKDNSDSSHRSFKNIPMIIKQGRSVTVQQKPITGTEEHICASSIPMDVFHRDGLVGISQALKDRTLCGCAFLRNADTAP